MAKFKVTYKIRKDPEISSYGYIIGYNTIQQYSETIESESQDEVFEQFINPCIEDLIIRPIE